MTPLRTILCSVDFSRQTAAVIEMGCRLAAGFNARLIVFHSVNFPTDPLHYTDAHERAGKRRQLTLEAEGQARAMMAGTAVSWDVHVAWGDPVETLADVAADTKADLVVAASRGLSGFQRMFMGTVIERAVRQVALPVLVLPPGRRAAARPDPDHLRCIVAACGPSPQEDAILRFAWDMARRFQAELHLVHALERPVNEAILDPTAGPYIQVQEELRRRIRWRLADALADVVRDWRSIHTAVEPGPPGEVLIAYARRRAADLVIVGVRPQGTVRKTIVGSTTEALLRKAPCAVLTLPVDP